MERYQNPFRPGAGQQPLYLAGRTEEQDKFRQLLERRPILKNLILTGVRGIGKTVLLEKLKPIAYEHHWLWANNEISESASMTEENIARRIVADLTSVLTPRFSKQQSKNPVGFSSSRNAEKTETEIPPGFDDLWQIYESTPGLTSDKLKAVIQTSRKLLDGSGAQGIIFAYDEAQNLSDQEKNGQYPLSTLLDVFSTLQRDHSTTPVMIIFSGLPVLFMRLNEARAYTERMFEVLTLDKLGDRDARDAIEKPIELAKSPARLSAQTVNDIIRSSGGYPYFLQYICKEIFDIFGGDVFQEPAIPFREIISKLDQDFFAPRWNRMTNRQRDLMRVIASIETSEDEFTTQEIAERSGRDMEKSFSTSSIVQMLNVLIQKGFVQRNRHGKYAFALPLMAGFVRRQTERGS